MRVSDRADAYLANRLHEILSETSMFGGNVVLEDKRNQARLRLSYGEAHERRYAMNLLLGLPYPQADIDAFLLETVLRPGDRCLDAGANIGATAYQMCSLGAKEVLCFEPAPALASRIRALNCPRVVVRAVALGDRRASVELTLSRAHNQGNTIMSGVVETFASVFGDAPETVEVPLSTLDDELLDGPTDPRLSVWKIDVEGAELGVVTGAAEVLRRHPPRAIMMERYGDVAPVAAALGPDWEGWRARVRRAPYGLGLRPIRDPEEPDGRGDHFKTAPTYLFVHKPQADRDLTDRVARASD